MILHDAMVADMRSWGWQAVAMGPRSATLRTSCAIATLELADVGVRVDVITDTGAYGAAVYGVRWYNPTSFREWLDCLQCEES